MTDLIEELARAMQSGWDGNDPTTHCNRMPSWDELQPATKRRWEWAAKSLLPIIEREKAQEIAPSGPNTDYDWQVYADNSKHNYDIGGPMFNGTYPCIATVYGGKIDADYIVSLHNSYRRSKEINNEN